MTPEARLVLLSGTRDAVDQEVIELLEGPLDWRRLLTIADRERAILPLQRTVQASGVVFDRPEGEALKQIAAVWEFRLRRLEYLLFETLRAYRTKDIEVVLLKGAAAALSVHDGFTRRPMIDVDLLVPAHQAEEAWAVAQTVGWAWDAETYPRDSYDVAHHHPPLQDASRSGVGLEVHTALWMPDHPFSFSESDLRKRSVAMERDGVRFRVPSPIDQLLHCCIHFAWSHRIRSHAWRAFHDVEAIVSSGTVDWTEFLELAESSRADTCCYWTLRLAGASVGLEVPQDVLRRLRPALPELALGRLERHFLMNLLSTDGGCPSLSVERRLWRTAIGLGRGSRGIALPWDRNPQPVLQRIASHGKSAPDWFRYLARLV